MYLNTNIQGYIRKHTHSTQNLQFNINPHKHSYEKYHIKPLSSRQRQYTQNNHLLNKPVFINHHNYKNNINHHYRRDSQHNSSLQNLQISRTKSQIIRSQSMNQIYQNQNIQMLQKINSILQKHSHQNQNKQANLQKQSINNTRLFRQQISAKIDRLQGYLQKIKKQRQKEQIPKNKQTYSSIKNHSLQVKEFQIQQKQKSYEQTKQNPKIGIQTIFSQLQKLKTDISKVREHALQVQKRNSLSKIKKLNNIQIDKSQQKIKHQFSKILNAPKTIQTKPQLQFNGNLFEKSVQSAHKTFSSHNNAINTAQYRGNNHLNGYDTIRPVKLNTTQTYNNFQNNHNKIQHPYNNIQPTTQSHINNKFNHPAHQLNNQKPKITFSFAGKR